MAHTLKYVLDWNHGISPTRRQLVALLHSERQYVEWDLTLLLRRKRTIAVLMTNG